MRILVLLAFFINSVAASAFPGTIVNQMGRVLKDRDVQSAVRQIEGEGDGEDTFVKFVGIEFEAQAKCRGDLRYYNLIFSTYDKSNDQEAKCKVNVSAGSCGGGDSDFITPVEEPLNALVDEDESGFVKKCEVLGEL